MHGTILRAFQAFLTETWGQPVWAAVARDAGAGGEGFEAMLTYDPALADRVVEAAARLLRRPRDQLLEDFGHALVSNPARDMLRRLLRFSGTGFADFLYGLDDLPARARLALPDLDLPELELHEHGGNRFALRCTGPIAGAGCVILGLLRAMADDYGALVLLDHETGPGGEVISIHLLDESHAEGRRFHLAPAQGVSA